MFIKQVVISGFKSYKDQTYVEPFSPGLNVIVGPNGSGKSNFFSAIQFVLLDSFSQMGLEARKQLLHEGLGQQVYSAYVEIIMDNSDNQMPISGNNPEVTLRRAIGLKKDEYFLDRKHVTKQEVVNLLESIGFSRSNPYYIVQQGKVSHMALMKDAERLDVLKDVAGTKVYDSKRSESLKLMSETDARRKEIDSALESILQRLDELKEERQELSKFLDLDKQRRCIEHCLFDSELKKVQEELRTAEERRLELREKSTDAQVHGQEVYSKMRDLENEIADLAESIEDLTSKKALLEKERAEFVQRRAKLELDVQEADQLLEDDSRRREVVRAELDVLNREIEGALEEVEKLGPALEDKLSQEATANSELNAVKLRIEGIFEQSGRTAQFSSVAERDAWLKDEVVGLQETVRSRQEALEEAEREVNSLEAQKDQLADKLEEITQERERRKNRWSELVEEKEGFVQRQQAATEKRKGIWTRQSETKRSIERARSELSKNSKNRESSMSKEVAEGLAAVKSIVEENDIAGVKGPLIELMAPTNSRYRTAVEVAAGGSLFHIVVDTDETASRILEKIKGRKGTRVTFMPLNRLRPKTSTFVDDTKDSMHLIKVLKYRPDIKLAIEQVFGQTVLARSLEVATERARQHNVNGVTLEGDQVNKRGAITGGFHDTRVSRLEAQDAIFSSQKSIRQLTTEEEELAKEVGELEVETNEVNTAIQKVDNELAELKAGVIPQQQENEEASLRIREIRTKIDELQKECESERLAIEGLNQKVESYRDEVGTPLDAGKKAAAKQLGPLTRRRDELQEQLDSIRSLRAATEGNKLEVESRLGANLQVRVRDLENELETLNVEGRRSEAQSAKTQLDALVDDLDDVTKVLKICTEDLETSETTVEAKRQEREAMHSEDSSGQDLLDSQRRELEQLSDDRRRLVSEQEAVSRKIRELGSLPSGLEEYQIKTRKELLSEHRHVAADLKKYSHVNRKAADQFGQFTQRREDLFTRKREIDEGAGAIRKLIDKLDEQKDSDIKRTFKTLASEFRKVFRELVPEGDGSLVMVTDKSVESEPYTGVGIHVKFGPGVPTVAIGQLSGGQKSIVALALIFAIQRCDPAPFYLFDEVDSALDATYRSAVAAMIQRQTENMAGDEGASRKCQFIATTFRPELISAAEKVYGITYKTKVSSINVIEKPEAMDIIQKSRPIDKEAQPSA